MVKNPPAMQESWIGSLVWEDPLEEGMATHSSILAWRIPWTEEPGGLQSMGSQSQTRLSTYFYSSFLLLLITQPAHYYHVVLDVSFLGFFVL